MASIISSVITQSNLQTDGRYTVLELHIDDQSNQYMVDYMADAHIDQQSQLAVHAENLSRELLEKTSDG